MIRFSLREICPTVRVGGIFNRAVRKAKRLVKRPNCLGEILQPKQFVNKDQSEALLK